MLLSVVLVMGMIVGMRIGGSNAATSVVHSRDALVNYGNGRVEELIRYIEAKYVDEVNEDALIDEAIREVLEQLDPHSNYLSKEQVREVSEQLGGNFEGIGVEFMMLDDTIVVIAPLAGGPSDVAGILAGDRIVAIGDSTIAGVQKSSDEITSQLKGKKGTQVRVGVVRPGEPELLYFDITRDEIPVFSVDASYMIAPKTGFIRVNRFSAKTYEEFMRAVETLVEEEQMEDLIIDLRQNPGGYLREATDMLSQLFKAKGMLLVYTEGRTVKRQEYKSTGRPFFDIQKLVVLIDEGSASASEILAGAIQDHDRGSLVGRRSFGKGLVQEQYPLSDGSAVRLTVARYYTPSGRLIQKDYEDKEAYQRDVQHRFETGELLSRDSIHQNDSTVFYTDAGRIVYGGGGITPDIFVPLDTSYLNGTFLLVRSYIPQYVLKNLQRIKREVGTTELDAFIQDYEPSRNLYNGLLTFVEEKDSVSLNQKDLQWTEEHLIHNLKARIGKHLFDDNAFYQILNEKDTDVLKGLEVIRSSNPLTIRE